MVDVLDHGYLKLVESWGSDQRIIESARMSTAKGFLGWGPKHKKGCEKQDDPGWACGCDEPGDEKLLKFLWDNQHCYDGQTEVLTQRGFIAWPEVTPDDVLGQWDAEQDSLTYEKPWSLVRKHYTGPMYRVLHGGVDLLVTPEHSMLVKRYPWNPAAQQNQWSTEWELLTAKELDHRTMVRYRKHAAYTLQHPLSLTVPGDHPVFPAHDDPQALLRLIGFFIGDGHAGGTRTNGVSFHLRKPRKITFLREVCAELGWALTECASDTYVVQCEGIGVLFRTEFYDEQKQKRVPPYLLTLCASDAEALLAGLRASDGTTKRGAWEYSTTSKQVAAAVQLLVLHAGGAAHIHDGEDLHRVMVLSRMREPVINQGQRNTHWVADFSGEVFCAHTRTGVLVVRRNGKIVLSGNSTPFEMAGFTVEVKAPIFVFREWHRHRVPFGYSEASARYVPLPDEDYIPTINRMMLNSKTNKQAGTLTGAPELSFDMAQEWQEDVTRLYGAIEKLYQKGLQIGVPKELARIVLPVGRYSCMRATSNLRGWLAFCQLRCAPGAQWEIRQYANEVAKLIKELFPRTYEVARDRTGMP